MPPGVLYRVKATYGYVKEDVDELSFEVGDIIRVIEYDDPEDQVIMDSFVLIIYALLAFLCVFHIKQRHCGV